MNKKNIENIYPLSPTQQGILFHTLYAPESEVYVVQRCYTFSKTLNIAAFKQAWQQVINQHPILRTCFYWKQHKEPFQVVHGNVQLPWQQYDWQEFPIAEQPKRLEAFLQADCQQGFNISQPPLMRLTLIQVAKETYHFIWSSHHLILDGWSGALVLQQVFQAYEALCHGRVVLLPRCRPYADYVAWLQQQDLSQAEAFWRKVLQGFTAPTQLRVSSSANGGTGYDEGSLKLSPATTTALQFLARQHKLTLNTLVQGAWAILLSRYSGEEDVVFGATSAGRPPALVGSESMVGLFINTLPVRVQVSGDELLIPWLQKLQAQQVEAQQYEYSPLVQVQGWSEVPRDLPLFESILVFENYPVDASLKEWSTETQIHNVRSVESTNYSITISANVSRELSLEILCDRSRFDAASITRMLGHLQTLLEGIVANPHQSLASLPLLTAAEIHQQLVEWNNTQTEYPQDKCIHQLFEEQVEKTPDAVAVVFKDQQLTYRELNQRANQLAHYLQKLGVGADVLVGICVERSLNMVITVLGVLKAGGAYVPLDPEQPPQRLAFMLQDADCHVLLTHKHLVETLPTQQGCMVCLDADWQLILQESESNLASSTVKAENLAYLIYTSGSTGQAKGVMVQHRSLVNAYLSWKEAYQLRLLATCHLQMANFSFDVFVGDLSRALCSGGKLVLCPHDFLLEPEKLYAFMRQQKIDCAEFVPAVFSNLIQYLKSSQQHLKFMHLVICGSDSWYGSEYRNYQIFLSEKTRLINSFGLTEATIDSTYFESRTGDLSTEQLVPIGRPFSNTQLYILDACLQPVPIGICGELYISGVNLARGYHQRPELTAEKFIPNLFSNEPGTRLYKTGDLAYYLPDGNIAFVGRTDNQVKIRGFRIELGEIEAVLAKHQDVQQAVVIAKQDSLVAYVVASSQNLPTAGQLRDCLKQQLPYYMVPNTFVFLESLPLTPNGKVNRKALPEIDTSELNKIDGSVAPRTPIEEMLAEIWAQILGLAGVGIHDNFFELGGHSLLATQVISQVRKAFQVEMPLRNLFEYPTVATFSDCLQSIRQQQLGLPSQSLQVCERPSELPLSFAQARLWFLDRLESEKYAYNMPSAVKLIGNLSIPALEQSLIEIISRHEALRTTFVMGSKQPMQVIAPQQAITLTIVDLQDLKADDRETEVQRLALAEAKHPFDLTTGPLLRVSLLQLNKAENILLLTMHHIAGDAWSMGVLVGELATLYESFVRGKQPQLPELPIQYADFAVWQRQWLQAEVLKTQLAYWKQQLDGAPASLNLPTDRPRPPVQTFLGETTSFVLSAELSEAIKTLSRQEGVTLFMTLLAAFKVLLYRYSGTGDIVVGSPIANRHRAELEGLIGFFVNTLVLRTDLSDNPTFRGLLSRVREVTLGAYDHQDLPFDLLVEELKPERDLSYTPLFQVMFILQNAPMSAIELSDLTLQSVATSSKTAKFDLTLSIQENESGIGGELEYNSDLFDATTIARMAGHFQILLEGIVANPQERVAQLPLLTSSEKYRLLLEWNNTQTEYPQDKCIHQLFEEQVEKSPNAVALVFKNKQLTYRELNQRANQLAHYLRKLGVQPEVPVCLCVDRSIEMVVGLLGILKAGGAYVPLDPAYPQERLEYIKQDVRSPLLLTQQQLKVELFDQATHVVYLDTDWEEIQQHSQENPVTSAKTINLAYVIYTSGSTGKPKGVEIAHGNVVNFLNAMQQTVELMPQDVLLAVTTIAFDIAALEIFLPLMVGASVVVASREVVSDGVQLSALLANSQATVMQGTPATWRMLLGVGWQGNKQLKILCGGEALPSQLANQLLQQCHRLWNLYGPTETTIWSTVQQVEFGDKLVSIGRPIANTQVYILDSHLQLTPIGIPGELYIGGTGVGRGYWHRPELTYERFISNPFTLRREQRLYKTGDLVRYRSDGKIEYIGRLDHQVKIRGFRIELGEIEAVLAKHQDVQQTVVIAKQDSLVAYVVASSHTHSVSQLRDFLRQQLPDYMVPNTFVFLESLPLTPNGKVNRKALPAPDTAKPESENVFRTLRTDTEKELVSIWSEVLNAQQVGIDDNFFDLGGHSLLIVQLFARIRAAFQIDLPLQTLFAAPTVETLAAKLEIARQAKSSTATVTNPTLDLKAEAVLDPVITAEGKPIEYITEPSCIFLTGATGFLGAFLLNELLQQTQADIYCLVRAANAEEGKQKIRRTLESYLIWNESQSSRIIPVVGDLSQPLLGLSEAQFFALAKKLDVIYHNGAWVHHASPYSTLKAANVLGTQEVLRLASQIKIKPVHFISTISVFSAPTGTGVQLIREQSSLDDYPVPEDGYAQSKWVAEKLVAIARDRGLAVSIYRPGRISGDSKTGAFNPNDLLYRLLIGCIQLGSIPSGDFIEGLLPVDYVSKAIVHLSQQQKSLGKAFHLLNPQLLNLKMLFNSILSFGYPLEQISHEQWYAELLKISEHFPNHPLYPLIPFFITSNQTQNFKELKFDCENTLNELTNNSIFCPPIDKQLLNTYVSYLIRIGFIQNPKRPKITLN